MADRVCVMQRGRDRRAGHGRPTSSPRPGTPIPGNCWPREPKARRNRPPPTGRDRCSRPMLKVWFPSKAGLFRRTVDHIKAVDGIICRCAGTDAGRGRRIGIGQDDTGPRTAAADQKRGRNRLPRPALDRPAAEALRPLRREMQMVFQDPYRLAQPAHDRSAKSSAKGWKCMARRARRGAARPDRRDPATRSASIPPRRIAIPMNSPAASGKASP